MLRTRGPVKSASYKRPHTAQYCLDKILGVVQVLETECRMVGSREWESVGGVWVSKMDDSDGDTTMKLLKVTELCT